MATPSPDTVPLQQRVQQFHETGMAADQSIPVALQLVQPLRNASGRAVARILSSLENRQFWQAERN